MTLTDIHWQCAYYVQSSVRDALQASRACKGKMLPYLYNKPVR